MEEGFQLNALLSLDATDPNTVFKATEGCINISVLCV